VSDRRSFSEIPVEHLRDHATLARVERVWERLAGELPAAAARRRPLAYAFALGSVTFALGLFVGVRWAPREQIPFAMFGAEPAEQPRPAAVAAMSAPRLVPSSEGAPRAHPAHRAAARHVDVIPLAEEVEPAPETAPIAAPASSGGGWQRLADEGQYAQALVALEASGGFDGALHDATADQLMSLVDVARATGQRDRALVALRRIVSEHGADPNAPVAAWMLGNELAKVRDLAGAEQAFAMYRALSPNGDFAEDALGRQFDMAADQGNRDHARRLAEQYLKEFPDGPRTADIQSQLERWAKKPAAGGASAASSAPDAGVPR